MTPVELAQEQLDAYNAHDLERFCACYADDVVTYRMPATTPALIGKPALREFYRTQRFNNPALHADLVARMAFGDKVIDHERIHGLAPSPSETVAVYQVKRGLIQTVWFFAAG